jgi:hypothetical protein
MLHCLSGKAAIRWRNRVSNDPSGSSGSSPPSDRKRRSPTIDLSAEEVKRGGEDRSAEPGTAGGPREPESSAGEDAAARPDEAAAKPDAPSTGPQRQSEREPVIPSAFAMPPRPRSAPPSGRGSSGLAMGLGAAALAGGLIALAGLFLLDRAGVLPLTDRTDVTATLDERAAELEEELAATQQAAERARENLQSQLAELNQRLSQFADLRDQVGGATPGLQQVEGLAERVAALADRVESAPELQTQLDQLAQQLTQLRSSFQQFERTLPPNQDLSALESDIAGLRDQVGQLQSEVSKLSGQLQDAASADQLAQLGVRLGQVADQAARAAALAPAVAAQALAAALETGRPFATELGAIRALGVEADALSQLEPYAEAGLPSRAALSRRFQDAMPQLVAAEKPPPEAGSFERIWQSARQVVEVRPAGPQEGASPAAVASRIEAALQAGDLPRALDEWQALPPDDRAALEDWAAQARAVVAGEALAQRLRSQALSALAPRD